MTKPRLSICIPTSAGREAMLAKNLPHTIEVAKALDAEIVISPNFGTTALGYTTVRFDRETMEPSGYYSAIGGKEYPVELVRVLPFPDAPIPMIDNLHRAYMAAEGEFCFPLGDDDELCLAGLWTALDVIEHESKDISGISAVYTPYIDRSDAGDQKVCPPEGGGIIGNFKALAGYMTSSPRFAPEAPLARTEMMKAAIKKAPPGVYFGFAQLMGLLDQGQVAFQWGMSPTYIHVNHGGNNAWKFAVENVEPMRAAWDLLVYKACQERGYGLYPDEYAWWQNHIGRRMTEYYALAAEGLRREGRDPGQYDWRAKLWSA